MPNKFHVSYSYIAKPQYPPVNSYVENVRFISVEIEEELDYCWFEFGTSQTPRIVGFLEDRLP